MSKRKGLELVLVFVFVISAIFVIDSRISANTNQAARNTGDKTIVIGQKIPFTNGGKPLNGLTVSGSGRFPLVSGKVGKPSLFRIILTDRNNNDYLMYDLDALTYQKNSLFSTYGTFKFKDQGAETAYLDNIYPKEIRIEQTSGVEMKVEGIDPAKDSTKLLSLGDSLGISIDADANNPQDRLNQKNVIRQLQTENKQNADKSKIAKINDQLKKEGKKWTAGETSVSKMTYQQKKDLYGGQVPNLQGLDYYVGGVYEFGQTNNWPSQDRAAADQNFPDSFDWRNRHGENWVTSVKNQSTCGGCWAFSAVASIEASLNVAFNRHLDEDLSDQWALCIDSAGCEGGYAEDAYQYLSESDKTKNLPKENILPYKSQDDSTAGVCPTPLTNTAGGVKVKDWEYYRTGFGDTITESQIKKALIQKGPISFSVDYFEGSQYAHAMLLVGWKTDTDGAPIWIIKNSYGVKWGEKGYLNSKVLSPEAILAIGWVTDPYYTNKDMTAKCVDNDKDGYYNWGVYPQRDPSCPSTAKEEEDCDDSNPALGPYDAKYNCKAITPPPKSVTPTPSPTPPPSKTAQPKPTSTPTTVSQNQVSSDPCQNGYLNLSRSTIFITDNNTQEVKVCGGTPPLVRPFRAKFKKRNIIVKWKDANTLEIKGVRLGVAAILVSDSKDPNNYKMIRVAILHANPTAAELEETTPSLVRALQGTNQSGGSGVSGTSSAATDCGTWKRSESSEYSTYNYYSGYQDDSPAAKCFMAKVGSCQSAKVIYDDSYSYSSGSYSSVQKYELEVAQNSSSCKIKYKVLEDKTNSSYSNSTSKTEGKEMTCELRNNDYDVQSRVKSNDLEYFASDVYNYLYDSGRNCSGSLVDWYNGQYSGFYGGSINNAY